MRKKRLIRTIIIVAFCAIVFSVIVMIWMKKDAEEYKKWQAQYIGTWVSPDGQYKMTVQRVTSAHIIFSVTNKNNLSLNYASATAVGDGEYSFSYKLQRGMDGGVTAGFGNTGKGVIRLKEKSLSLDVPKLEKFEEGLQFRGALTKESEMPDIKKKELQALMGKDRPQEKKAEKTFYVAEAQEGKVERVHINWDAASDRKGYEEYEMSGINPICMVSDLQAQFGDPAAEEELSENRYKRVYRKDGYQYEFITDGYGLVTEGDCQYEKPKRGRRDGDFIREGSTVLRYLGDYEKSRTVTLPQGTKKIASGAFTVTPDTVQQKYVKSLKLSIPSGIEIERNAFENCSSMQITLEEGWTSVPEEAFAHMVGAGGLRGKAGWVKVNLPRSLRRLEAKAFETNWFEGGEAYTEEDTMGGVLEIGVQPVTVLLNEELEYIGDNALYGICNTMLPKKVKYIGANFTLLPSVAFWNASDVKVQKPDGFYSWEYCYNIALPEQLEYVSEKGFYFWTPEFSMRAIDGNFTVLQIPENAKNVPCLSNILVIQYSVNEKNNKYSSKDGWLFSRDGKKLYRTTSEIDFSKKQKGREVTFKKISKGTYKTYVRIKEGIEEIASQAFASIVNRSADILDVQFITPNSLKCIDRGALFENRSYFDTWDDSVTSVKIAGEVPQFTGDISPDSAYKRKVYVKKQYREKFIKELFEGQQLSDKQKNQIKKCIIGY